MDGADVSSGAMLLSPDDARQGPPSERARFDLGGINDDEDDENDDEGIGDKTLDEEGKTERTDIPTTTNSSDLVQLSSQRFGDGRGIPRNLYANRSADTLAEQVDDDDEGEDANSAVTGNSSHPTTSGMTSSTDRFPIDFSNRAKLPRGVVNVRPHLEKVDNVPLLVSLFTDCTPETSTEMMEVISQILMFLLWPPHTPHLGNGQYLTLTQNCLPSI